jgi:allophanate hydrolase
MSLSQKIRDTYARIRARGDDHVWISLLPEERALTYAEQAEQGNGPLRGRTFAIKDNIDLADLPTTAGCPEYAYQPEKHAEVVRRLIAAGAIPIGKTNLDQFATGLNGTRSPYGIPQNAINPAYIPGGSSSGSAVAVAAGLVDFALGTDTAGSGRVPAAFHGLVGFKPTRGRWSTSGLVPACRTLDCITVFTKTVTQAAEVDGVLAAFDPADPYSRLAVPCAPIEHPRIGILPESEREFFGDTEYARLYEESIQPALSLGWSVGEFDYRPFREAASLLYAGSWVAERYAAIQPFLESQADAIHPVVRQIIEGATRFTAVDTFRSQYRLAALARETESTWKSYDALLLPTAGTIYTIEQMLADPIQLNSNLGRYTNFMNLLDLSGLAIPAGKRKDGLPFGVTLFSRAWTDGSLLSLAQNRAQETQFCAKV